MVRNHVVRLLLLLVLATPPLVLGLPAYQGQIPNGGRVPCPPSGTTGGCGSDGLCAGVGHLSCAGGGERNAFGLAFAAANHQWTKALCQADSDGDGFTNGEELGDPCCAWQAGSSAEPSQGINGATHPGFKSSLPTAHTLSTCPSSPPSAAGPPPPAATSARPANAFLPNEPQFEKTFIIKPFAVPAEETTYIWSQFDFPECSNQSCYVIGVDIINNSTKVLHHIIATLCPARYNASLDGTLAPPFMDCANLLAEWAPGREPMMAAHDFASLPIGASFNKPVGSVMLQFHYNNPSLLAGLRDTSGIRVYYTTQPREQNLGELLAIQLTIDGSLSIPARRNRHYLGMICEIRGLSRPITPTEMWYHAHLLGREFHSFVKPADGSPVYELYRDARWSFANQNMVDVIARNLSLHNGDVLLTVAVFNSTERSENTIIGFETTAEMFWHGLMYYPYQTGTSCPGRLMQGDLEPCEDPLDVIKSRLALPAPFDGLVPYQAIKTIKVHACDYEAVAAITNFSDLMARADDCFRSSFRSNSACTRLWSSIRDCACPNYPGTEQIPPSQLAVLQNYSRQFLNSMDPCLSPDAFASTMGCANTTVGYDVWTLQTCDYATNFTKPFIAAYSIPQVCTKVPTLAPEPVTVKVSGATDPNVFRTTLILGALLVFVLMVSL